MLNLKSDYAPIIERVLLRFLRTFASGFIATLVIEFQNSPSFTTFENFKIWLVAIALGAIAGGLAGLDKLIRG